MSSWSQITKQDSNIIYFSKKEPPAYSKGDASGSLLGFPINPTQAQYQNPNDQHQQLRNGDEVPKGTIPADAYQETVHKQQGPLLITANEPSHPKPTSNADEGGNSTTYADTRTEYSSVRGEQHIEFQNPGSVKLEPEYLPIPVTGAGYPESPAHDKSETETLFSSNSNEYPDPSINSISEIPEKPAVASNYDLPDEKPSQSQHDSNLSKLTDKVGVPIQFAKDQYDPVKNLNVSLGTRL